MKCQLSLTSDLKTPNSKGTELKGLKANPNNSKHTKLTSLLGSLAQQQRSLLPGGGAEISKVRKGHHQ